MIYTDKTREAMLLAYDAHADQLDKGGVPYILHPVHLAEQMDDETSTIVALLHDVVEDTNVGIVEIKDKFGIEVAEAVLRLTKGKHEDYMDYIRNVSKDAIAKKIKIEDLKHNIDSTRLKNTNYNVVRLQKYRNALDYLNKTM